MGAKFRKNKNLAKLRDHSADMLICLLTLSPCADPEGGGGRGSEPPLTNHKKNGFLSNAGPDPLKNHKATKPTFNVGPLSADQRIAISMAFRWQADYGPL